MSDKLFDADFSLTSLGKKMRLFTRIEDLEEYTMDDQLREEASLGII